MILLLLIGLGLILGSFVNALVWRLHEGRDWVRERSECTHCHHPLAAKDLVPVFSWLTLRGKCRYCHAPIHDNPLAELAVPLLFVLSYLWWSVQLQGVGLLTFVFWCVFLVGFVALASYDFRWFTLPNKIVFPLIGLAVIQVLAVAIYDMNWRIVLSSAIGALVVSGTFYVLFQVSNGRWIGGGDVKLGIVLGLLAGGLLEGLLLLFLASLTAMVATIPLLAKGKAHRKSHVPFGPFLILGLIIVQLFGGGIIDWYTGLIYA
jgi:leader peptidase (prepilin peptidase)/N-methyltransferase